MRVRSQWVDFLWFWTAFENSLSKCFNSLQSIRLVYQLCNFGVLYSSISRSVRTSKVLISVYKTISAREILSELPKKVLTSRLESRSLNIFPKIFVCSWSIYFVYWIVSILFFSINWSYDILKSGPVLGLILLWKYSKKLSISDLIS